MWADRALGQSCEIIGGKVRGKRRLGRRGKPTGCGEEIGKRWGTRERPREAAEEFPEHVFSI